MLWMDVDVVAAASAAKWLLLRSGFELAAATLVVAAEAATAAFVGMIETLPIAMPMTRSKREP